MAKKTAATRKPAAKISHAKGKFFLTVRGKKREIVGISKAQLSSAAGKPIEPIFYKNAVVAINWKPGPGILCYVPVPDILDKVAPEVQQTLLKAFVDKGIITEAQASEISGVR